MIKTMLKWMFFILLPVAVPHLTRMFSNRHEDRSENINTVLTFESALDAYMLIDPLTKIADEYGFVTVHDLLSLLGEETNHGDHSWGWPRDVIDSTLIFPVNDGTWSVTFPGVISID